MRDHNPARRQMLEIAFGKLFKRIDLMRSSEICLSVTIQAPVHRSASYVLPPPDRAYIGRPLP
jgi:hypothetical protein